MHIDILFFASLRELVGQSGVALESSERLTAGQAWTESVGNIPMPGNTLIAVNQAYVKPSQILQEGDEVAFFPPVTGG
ncbi:MAG TPA: MoaD/ThiS family protein [Gammaproteobacteria bacterium]|nr:MoaD/ThiS family protein [Gammaproteobacteria bacterium]